MNLQIRNPRAYELAKKLAEKHNTTMTDAVIEALEDKLKSEAGEKPLWERIQPILERVRSRSQPGGRDLTKDEIDAMWGHE
ncbi:type II toxin-antitoxin system VapB family antitoxin [Mesorhizobium sp. BAC0120]|uniref:type II toxin-antitoxin system VapB family antitoxin n=1 Tax=Mesorhizobium sp. BAC0120 TaxID=3090670 RepID=UPI00298C0091|nr:type II toxin-antitoxin system VapB family antitoxin [Mesorhizobium sp. BAC0120]MDW6020504.1 type II toxin-antitoxin system VapB family antitoxin [Mesorhizobium sp. BAC0120]